MGQLQEIHDGHTAKKENLFKIGKSVRRENKLYSHCFYPTDIAGNCHFLTLSKNKETIFNLPYQSPAGGTPHHG